MTNNFEQEDGKNKLIALINNKKIAFENKSISRLIRRDFEIVSQAREVASWAEISEALGHKGKAGRIRQAYFYEKLRRAKKGKEVVPEKKKWTPAPKEEKKEVPGSDEPDPAGGGVRLIKGKEDFADLGDGVQRI